MKINKLIIFLAIILLSANSSLAVSYTDVSQDSWGYREISQLSDDGIMTGTNDKFSPDKPVTRAEYATMILKAIEQQEYPIETMYTFQDLDSKHWARMNILRAVNLDILKPSDKNYIYPNDYITRLDVITFMTNILQTEGITKKDALFALQNSYNDFEEIPDWFKVTAGKAEVLGVIPKVPHKEFELNVYNKVTRAEMAMFLYKLRVKLAIYPEDVIKVSSIAKTEQGIVIENAYTTDDIAVIPEKTILPITIFGQLSTRDVEAGQEFNAKFADNIIDSKRNIIIPKDTLLYGVVLDSTKAMHLVRNGSMVLKLYQVRKDDNYLKFMGIAECRANYVEPTKVKQVTKNVIKGKNYNLTEGRIIYIKLFQQLKVNVNTKDVIEDL